MLGQSTKKQWLSICWAPHLVSSVICMGMVPWAFSNHYILLDNFSDQRDEELPTLLHFAAKYGLKNLTALLLTCPGALQAYSVANKHGHYPNTIAEKHGFRDLRQFIDEYVVRSRRGAGGGLGIGNARRGPQGCLCTKDLGGLHLYQVLMCLCWQGQHTRAEEMSPGVTCRACVRSKSLQSCPTLCDPWTVAH